MFRKPAAIILTVLFAISCYAAIIRAPYISSITPAAVTAGSGNFVMVVNGANFTRTSVVRWNGVDQPTGFVASTQLRIKVPASYLASPGAVSISVYTYAKNRNTVVAKSNTILLSAASIRS